MADRAVVYEVNQIGVETTPGTAVAANKLLQAMHVALKTEADVAVYGPMGQKYDTLSILNKEWASGDVSGRPTYTELVYPLSGLLTTPVITTPGGGTLSRQWDWSPSSTAPDTPKTFTIEQGVAGAAAAEKAAYLVFRELTLTFSRNGGVDMKGAAIAQKQTTGVTLTATPTAVGLIPIAPGQVSVYMDDTAANIGTTKLTRDFVAEVSIGGRFNPIWPLNAAVASFDGVIEAKPTTSLKLTMGNDAVGRALLTTMRAGATKYVRIEAVGPLIEGSINYLFRFDVAAMISAAPGRGDVDGLSTLEWSFHFQHDAAWGKAYSVQLINTLTAL